MSNTLKAISKSLAAFNWVIVMVIGNPTWIFSSSNVQPHLSEKQKLEFEYIIFRRGFGLDQMTAYFIQWKIDALVSRIVQGFLRLTGLRKFFSRKRRVRYVGNQGQQEGIGTEYEEDDDEDGDEHDLFIERIRIQNMKLSLGQLISKTTIQEPTFEKIIILYRMISTEGDDRAIHVKHFKHIPMADMEIVLPEKKNPGLTPLDWVKFLVSAAIGLVTVVTQLRKTKADIKVLAPICSAVVGYCAKIYFTFQKNLSSYQNLITRSMYDKQLDSGRGTLLHLCDDVIQQEVKEVVVAFFVMMKYGKFTLQDLDRKCEELILDQFNESCNFDMCRDYSNECSPIINIGRCNFRDEASLMRGMGIEVSY
ncbi:FACT complex subunit SSRP1 [Bienertia sinuspersici]